MSPNLSSRTCSRLDRAIALSIGAAALAALLNLPAVAALTSLAALAMPLFRLARSLIPDRSTVSAILATFTGTCFVMLAAIELLSVFSLLGSRIGWTALIVLLAAVFQILVHRSAACAADTSTPPPPPLRNIWREPWTIVVAPMALVFGLIFAQSLYLNTFTGINHGDGQATYMSRSIRYLQDGNLNTYSTVNDFLPHFQSTLASYLLLFFQSESAVVLLSSLFGAVVCLTLFELARVNGAPVSLAVFVGLAPLGVPIFTLHLGTTNADVHTAAFLVLSLYFLVRARALSSPRHVVLAAATTAMALATKPTFWSAAPALGLLWLFVLASFWRFPPATVARYTVVVGLVFALGGAHFIRNLVTQGFLVSPGAAEWGEQTPTIVDWPETIGFRMLATGYLLMTPNVFVRPDRRPLVEAGLQNVGESLGFTLPNRKYYAHADRTWSSMFEHVHRPFHSDTAGLGAVFPLLLLPAIIVGIVDTIRRTPSGLVRTYALAFPALYVVAMGIVVKYAPDQTRYLIEVVGVWFLLVPALLVRLPRILSVAYLAAVTGFMLYDGYSAYSLAELRPPEQVTVVPREDQYATFNAPERFDFNVAARMLDRKYPVEEWPEIFTYRVAKVRTHLLEFPFLDPQARRRLTYWIGDIGHERPAWPPALLVDSVAVAEQLQTRFPDQLVLDRLSGSIWIALPRDRLRLLWYESLPRGREPETVQLEAVVEPGRYAQPEYRFTVVTALGGNLVEELRGFSDDPHAQVPMAKLARSLEIQAEVRETGSGRVADAVRVSALGMLLR